MIFEKEGKQLSLEEFEKLTGAKWVPGLDFENFSILSHFVEKTKKLHKKGGMSREQLWLGKYFQKELSAPFNPEVAIRWINPSLGWGVFALKDFKKMEFVAEYTGKVRKRHRKDEKNSYCFEYLLAPGVHSKYTIDALDQGGLARYINHSFTPNLLSSLATLDGLTRIILFAKEPIAKGTQLCYDYGPDYWSKRTAPVSL